MRDTSRGFGGAALLCPACVIAWFAVLFTSADPIPFLGGAIISGLLLVVLPVAAIVAGVIARRRLPDISSGRWLRLLVTACLVLAWVEAIAVALVSVAYVLVASVADPG